MPRRRRHANVCRFSPKSLKMAQSGTQIIPFRWSIPLRQSQPQIHVLGALFDINIFTMNIILYIHRIHIFISYIYYGIECSTPEMRKRQKINDLSLLSSLSLSLFPLGPHCFGYSHAQLAFPFLFCFRAASAERICLVS